MRARITPAPIRGPRGTLPGLAAERTRLAWDRTALGFGAHAVVLLLRDPGDMDAARGASVVLSVALAVWAAFLGHRRAAAALRDQPERAGAAVPALGLAALALGLLDVGVVLAA